MLFGKRNSHEKFETFILNRSIGKFFLKDMSIGIRVASLQKHAINFFNRGIKYKKNRNLGPGRLYLIMCFQVFTRIFGSFCYAYFR